MDVPLRNHRLGASMLRRRRLAVGVKLKHVRQLDRLVARVVEEDLQGHLELTPTLLRHLKWPRFYRCAGKHERQKARAQWSATRGSPPAGA